MTSVQSSEVSTIFPNVCKQQNRVRVARMGRVRRRTSIARDNWLTTLIRCAAVWMKERRAGMVSNKGKIRGRGKVSRGRKVSEANSRVSSKGKERKANSRDERASRGNQDSSKALKTVNSKVVSRRVALKTAASHKATETVAGSIVRE